MPESISKVLFIAFFVAGAAIRTPYAKRSRKQQLICERASRWEWLLLCVAFLGMQVLPFVYLLTSWLAFADYRIPLVAGLLGAPTFAGALWLLWRSHADLGQNFSAKLGITERHALVTHGVYSRIRHPMYTAHLLWGIAQALLLQNWVAGFSLLAVMAPLLLFRVPREEGLLVEHFGEGYRAYMARTGRFMPRLVKE